MTKNTIELLEEELRQAMLVSDVNKLDELIADSLVFTIPAGTVVNKQADLEAYRSGIQKINKLEPFEQFISLYDNLAVVTVKMQLAGKYCEEAFLGDYCYTRIWSKINDHWQVIAGHASQIP